MTMQYLKGIEYYLDSHATAVTLGKFDGLHKGHQKLITQIQEYAGNRDVKSVLVAFDMTPLQEKLGITKQKIMTNAERKYLLDGQVDYLIQCPFTRDICDMEAERFILEILVGRLHARYVVVGEDFRFGHGRQGDAAMLKAYEAKGRFQVVTVPKERYQERGISSTYVKEVLPTGDMELVQALLGYPYTIIGNVVHGNRIGKTLGIPTMNLRAAKNKLLPAFGVYFCQVRLEEQWHNGICNIGIKPTVKKENPVSIECHLFDYQEDAYGKEIEVRIYHRKRGEIKFPDVSALKEQMQKDIAKGREYFTQEKGE